MVQLEVAQTRVTQVEESRRQSSYDKHHRVIGPSMRVYKLEGPIYREHQPCLFVMFPDHVEIRLHQLGLVMCCPPAF